MFNGPAYLAHAEAIANGIEPAKALGSHKDKKQVTRDIIVTVPRVELTEEEDNKRQDEFLKRHGI